VAAVVIALEICGSSLTAKVTVNALIIHVIGTCHVLGVFVCDVSHDFVLGFGVVRLVPCIGLSIAFFNRKIRA